MQARLTRLILVMALSAAILACATTAADKLVKAGGSRLNGEQVTRHISGKTEEWPTGGAYYDPAGASTVKWQGDLIDGTWSVSEDGELCITASTGQNINCHVYIDVKGVVRVALTKLEGIEETGVGGEAPRLFAGNRLADL